MTVDQLRRLLERYPGELEVVVPMEYGAEALRRPMVRRESMMLRAPDVDLPPWLGPYRFTSEDGDEATRAVRVLALGRIRE